MTPFERKGRDARQFGDPKRDGFGQALELPPRCNHHVDRCETFEGLPDVGLGGRSKRLQRRSRIFSKPCEYRNVQR